MTFLCHSDGPTITSLSRDFFNGLLGDVTAGVLEGYRNARLRAGKSPNTVNKELRHVRAALRWALEREYINRVPSFRRAVIRVDRKQLPAA